MPKMRHARVVWQSSAGRRFRVLFFGDENTFIQIPFANALKMIYLHKYVNINIYIYTELSKEVKKSIRPCYGVSKVTAMIVHSNECQQQ